LPGRLDEVELVGLHQLMRTLAHDRDRSYRLLAADATHALCHLGALGDRELERLGQPGGELARFAEDPFDLGVWLPGLDQTSSHARLTRRLHGTSAEPRHDAGADLCRQIVGLGQRERLADVPIARRLSTGTEKCTAFRKRIVHRLRLGSRR
jgi:hypothetical protein